ncbi:hypothetical protein S2091_1505 [Solimicrobium silvestre]|uniref:Uncharacterized protein n=1 Tax=Solimicrobium silvestre TaxID=2099400 RepID=A0A2S9H204_9BURK|nr:hypothetical protein S2091_1505 [Solimicrobium silvestre]
MKEFCKKAIAYVKEPVTGGAVAVNGFEGAVNLTSN